MTATLAAGAHIDKDCFVGFACGSGLNIAYVERVSRIENWEEKDKLPGYKKIEAMDLNTEFCAIGDTGSLDFIKTVYDFDLDMESLFPGKWIKLIIDFNLDALTGKNTFEKIIGGSYTGDLVRRVLLDLAKNKALFNGIITKELETYDYLSGIDFSSVEGENGKENNKTLEMIKKLGYDESGISEDDINIIKYVCAIITIRGASLTALGLATIIKRIDMKTITIAASGSTIEKHPKLARQITDFTKELVGDEKEIKLILVDDGAGKGGGLVAAIAQEYMIKDEHRGF